MTGIAIVGLHYRPVTRIFRIVDWAGLALLIIYVMNSMTVYLHGH